MLVITMQLNVITQPHAITVNTLFLSLCLFLSVCFHAVRGIPLDPTSTWILFKRPYLTSNYAYLSTFFLFQLIFYCDEFGVQLEKLSLPLFKFYEIGNYHKFKDYQRSLLSQQWYVRLWSF